MSDDVCNYYKFFHKKWDKDTDVKLMSIEQIGAYWTLLVLQMNNDCIPGSTKQLASLLKGMDHDYFMTKIWDPPEPLPPLKNKFKPVEGKEGFLHNLLMTEIMDQDKATVRGKKAGGNKSAEVARTDYEKKVLAEVTASSGKKFDFGGMLADFPRRKDRKGFEDGLRLMQDTITEDDEFARLKAAIKAYARERLGQDKKYNLRLDSFMKKWTSYVPDDYEEKESQATETKQEAVTTIAPTGRMPWEPGRYDTADVKQRLADYWTEERKQRFLAGDDPRKDQPMTQGAN